MPTPDETRSCARSSRPAEAYTLDEACQASVNGRGQIFTGAIFLLNCKSPLRERLAGALRSSGNKVYVPEEHGMTVYDVTEDELQLANLVMFDVHSTSVQILSDLGKVSNMRRNGGPFLIALLTTRCDAEFQLKVEELVDRAVDHATK